ncbi:hypothetical protein EYF80_036959 [Liparis tanakae]|uniref:Uncharacterized protein n=1 Tax=Liparis tanakae TaxID=230148 RepID=A0A4Z2GHK3_9TELE|nr:hypothetical protein EYF80_036959 [Liparis tanakae]
MHGVDLQPRAHVQEVGHAPRLQQRVDRHPAPRRGVQQVLEDLQVECTPESALGDSLGRSCSPDSESLSVSYSRNVSRRTPISPAERKSLTLSSLRRILKAPSPPRSSCSRAARCSSL